MSGYDAVNLADVGLFSVRSADGGDLTNVLPSSPDDTTAGRAGDPCARPDLVNLSPDGSRMVINRISRDGCGTLLLVAVDNTEEIRLNPKGTVPVDLEFWDFLERGRISEAWSPDGS